MYFLPQEVLELILKDNVLSFYDVSKFASSCSHFWHSINTSNQIWKSKFKQRWPQLMKNLMIQSHPVTDWLDSCKQRFLIGRQTMKLVNNMSALHMKQMELNVCDFKPFEELYSSSGHKLALLSIIDELMLCANHENRNTNLTTKYYCEKVLRHLRQLYLSEKWDIFKNLPPEEQLLERGAVIVAQWCQPLEEIADTAIATKLDALADEVRERLRQEHGDKHPVLLVPAELRAQWRRRNLNDNHYSPHVSLQVLQTSSTMFKQLGFFGEIEKYHPFKNAFINKVLELRRGSRFTLGVVYESVTRRLGIKCELITSCYGHILLGWRDTYRPDGPSEYFYIDVVNGGTLLDKDNYPQFVTDCDCCSMSPASATKVVECMSSRLVNEVNWCSDDGDVTAPPFRITLELSYLVNPTCLNTINEYASVYMQHKLDLAPLRRSLQENISLQIFDAMDYDVRTLMDELNRYCRRWRHHKDNSWKVKRREDDAPVKYAVGMVLRHLRYNYVGVVTGWDSSRHQPFYNVLTRDGIYKFSREEKLELVNSPEEEYKWIPHIEVGRYFDRFCGTHYQPNSELERLYPEDMPVLRKCLGLP